MKFSILDIILIYIVLQVSLSALSTRNDLRLCIKTNQVLNMEMPRSK
jgi:hypothetical protein